MRTSLFWIVLVENYLRPSEVPDLALRLGFRELINQEMVQKENDLVRGMPVLAGGGGCRAGSGGRDEAMRGAGGSAASCALPGSPARCRPCRSPSAPRPCGRRRSRAPTARALPARR